MTLGGRAVTEYSKFLCALAGVVLLVGLVTTGASAARPRPFSTPPTPGSASQIAALVAASPAITSLPSTPDPSLSAEGTDSANQWYPITRFGCTSATTNPCVFGDLKSKKVIAALGDSHAQMWLSALVPAAQALGYRLVLFWSPGCPAADVTVYNQTPLYSVPAGPYYACNTFRTRAIASIKKLRPTLVLMSNRTSQVYATKTAYFTNAQWQAGVKKTVDLFKRARIKVAIVGDTPYLPHSAPPCLAAYPTAVQTCSAPNPNQAAANHVAAEQKEAKTLKIGYINTLPWLCVKTVCSPVIGDFLVYLDQTHVDETYAAYLAGVMQAAIKPLL